MITIITAPPRTGKTALMSYLIGCEMFNRNRIKACYAEIDRLNNGGYFFKYPYSLGATNYNLIARRFGFSPRASIKINPFLLGFKNDFFQTVFLAPYSVVGIMEAQKYFDSRNFKNFGRWRSNFFEMHGHNYLDFYLDTQRPNLIDINIRDLASFIEVMSMTISKKIVTWTVRILDCSASWEQYLASGKKNTNLYIEKRIVAPRSVLDFYETREGKPLFYAGNSSRQFNNDLSEFIELSKNGFERYIKNYGDEMPKNYYKKEI